MPTIGVFDAEEENLVRKEKKKKKVKRVIVDPTNHSLLPHSD